MTATADMTKTYWDRPWESDYWVTHKIEVPFEKRPWCFNIRKGRPDILDTYITIERDEKNAIKGIHEKDRNQQVGFNRFRYPELSWGQVVAIFDDAEREGISLKAAARKYLSPDSLSADDKRKIAMAPELFVRPKAAIEQARLSVEREEVEAFWSAGVSPAKPQSAASMSEKIAALPERKVPPPPVAPLRQGAQPVRQQSGSAATVVEVADNRNA